MKSIYDEAIKVITYLQYQSTHLKGNRVTIYFPKKDIETLENLLIHSQKQEKLLELYKEALETNFEGITLIKLVNKTLRTQIKELENEKRT